MSRGTIRALAVGAIAAQVVFVMAWIVAGALEPGYSHARQGVSELGASTAAHPWIVNGAIALLGVSFVALGLALRAVLPRRRAGTVGVLLFVAAGVTTALAGPLNLDCEISRAACHHLLKSGHYSSDEAAHLWLSLAGELALTATPFALAVALRPSPVSAAAFGAGLFGLAIGVISWPLFDGPGGVPDGLVQRFGLLLIHEWVLIVAGGILYATRAAPRPGVLVPLRPRDFMAGEWTGDGDLVLRPLFIGRRFAQRFSARRTTTSISDTIWRIDDVASFGGREMRRQTYVEFVADDRLRLTANDLPDGADLWLEEGGYRMAPCRMAFPIGPLPIYVRVHDTSYMERDGTFVNRYEARDIVFGIPLARTTFRVRPVATAGYSRASASDARPASSEASPTPG